MNPLVRVYAGRCLQAGLALLALLAACSPAATPTPTQPPTATPQPPISAITLPAGADGLLDIPLFGDWDTQQDGMGYPVWQAQGLPAGASAEFTQEADNPADAFVILRTAPETAPGTYPLNFSATSQSHTRQTQASLTIVACGDSFTSGTITAQAQTAVLNGGPSSLQYGDSAPVWTLCGSAVRHLSIHVISAITQTNQTVPIYNGTFSLYRLLTSPPNATTLRLQTNLIHNAEQVATGTDGLLDWPVESGVYLLVFPQSPLLDGASAPYTFYPQISVTFSVALNG